MKIVVGVLGLALAFVAGTVVGVAFEMLCEQAEAHKKQGQPRMGLGL